MKTKCFVSAGFAVMVLASATRAQPLPTCPNGAASPLQALAGTWTFSAQGVGPSTVPFSSTGTFLASISSRAGSPTGILAITQSSSGLARLEKDAGTYQVFPDCSGGTLTFNLSSRPITFDFWFVKQTLADVQTGTEIRLVSQNDGLYVVGNAKGVTVLQATADDQFKTCVAAAKAALKTCVPGPGVVCSADFVGAVGDCTLVRLGLK